jgi:hypothetical protein
MTKKLILIFFLFPILSYSQDKYKLDSLNRRYDSILNVMKRPQMKDSMHVLNKLIFLLQMVDSERYSREQIKLRKL